MKNEMDFLRMNENHRLAWLRANRFTLLVVGLVWMGMIAGRFAAGDTPWFLIAMVPAFALLRLGAYLWYRRAQ